MTNTLTAADLVIMRAAQTQSLMDTCVVQTQSVTVDTYGQGIETFTDGSAIACRFVPSNRVAASEVNRTTSTITITPATVRLPLGTTVTPKDRVKITKRFGETLGTALIFGVDAVSTQGPTCITVTLKDVD